MPVSAMTLEDQSSSEFRKYPDRRKKTLYLMGAAIGVLLILNITFISLYAKESNSDDDSAGTANNNANIGGQGGKTTVTGHPSTTKASTANNNANIGGKGGKTTLTGHPSTTKDSASTANNNANIGGKGGKTTVTGHPSTTKAGTANNNANIGGKGGKTTVTGHPSTTKVCNTTVCQSAASRIGAYMNLSANPCEDFSQFVCGQFYKKAQSSNSGETQGALTKADVRNMNLIEKLLSSPEDSQSPNSFANKMRRLYKACLDEDAMESHGLADYTDTYRKEWPTLNTNWTESTFNLQAVINKAAQRFSFVLFSLTPVVDNSGENDIYVLMLDRPITLLQNEEEVDDSKLQAFAKYYEDVSIALGADKAIAAADARKVTETYMKILQLGDSGDEEEEGGEEEGGEEEEDRLNEQEKKQGEPTKNNEMESDDSAKEGGPRNEFQTLEAMNTAFPYLDWVQVVQSLYPDGSKKINSSLKVMVIPEHFQSLGAILKNTDKRTLQNMFGFQHALSLVDEATKKMREIKAEFKMGGNGNGKGDERSRVDYCSNKVNKIYNLGLAKLISKERFSDKAYKFMNILVDNIKEAYKRSLETVPWMQNSTRMEALKKLKAMGRKVGIRSQDFSEKDIDAWYIDYNVTGVYNTDLIQNKRQASIRSWSKLNQDRIKWRWTTSMTVVDAFYDQAFNEAVVKEIKRLKEEMKNSGSVEKAAQKALLIQAEENTEDVFPLGILQRPFFEQDLPSYLNYGGAGQVIGHETGHGFDVEGKEFDWRGRVRNWWTQQDADKYNEVTKCFVDQYNAYNVTAGGNPEPGVNVTAENIADALGAAQAYRAYQTYAAGEGKTELPLPDLGLTKDQLFFVAYALGHCSSNPPEERQGQSPSEIHSLSKFRILGPLQNMEDFSKAFNCKAGDYMNPAKRCVLW